MQGSGLIPEHFVTSLDFPEPYKFNAARRHKFEKKRYRVTNRASYSESLRRQDDLTVWFDADALDLWVAPRRLARGG